MRFRIFNVKYASTDKLVTEISDAEGKTKRAIRCVL